MPPCDKTEKDPTNQTHHSNRYNQRGTCNCSGHLGYAPKFGSYAAYPQSSIQLRIDPDYQIGGSVIFERFAFCPFVAAV